MREMVFKNLTSDNKRRKDLFVSETTERNGIKTVARRHSLYMVNGHNRFNTPEELAQWKSTTDTCQKRHVFIFKKRDTKEKKDTFICDVVGKCYAVIKNEVYAIGFKHSFEIDFQPTKQI